MILLGALVRFKGEEPWHGDCDQALLVPGKVQYTTTDETKFLPRAHWLNWAYLTMETFMKTVFLAIALAFTAVSAYAEPLLKAYRAPGFERRPARQEFVLEQNGRMTLTTVNLRDGDNTKKVEDLGQLSAYALASIAEKISAVKDLPLEDAKKGTPFCTDTPSYSVSAYVNGQPKEISRKQGCHEWKIASNDSSVLVVFAYSLLGM